MRAWLQPLTNPKILLQLKSTRAQRPRVEGDPKSDTRASAAYMVGVLWAAASQGLTVKELRAAIGLSRERLEDAYEFMLANPPLGLAVQRHTVTSCGWSPRPRSRRRSSATWNTRDRRVSRGQRSKC